MKVAFYQPRHFNRTERKTNPFFDPIISVCEKNGIPYRIYQPYRRPDTGYPKVYSSQYLRKFVRLFRWSVGRFLRDKKEHEIDRLAGKVWNVLTFGRHRADVYVTIAAELRNVLSGVNPMGRIIDVQHGIIYSSHAGYFADGGRLLPDLAKDRNLEFWVYGRGFASQFLSNPANSSAIDGRVKVIGDVTGHAVSSWNGGTPRALFVSLQLTSECTYEENKAMYLRTVEFLRRAAPGGMWHGMPVLLRHHPRYNNCFDISPLLKEFPCVKIDERTLGEIACDGVAVHATLDSTTAFDVAAYGVPTYFIGSENAVAADLVSIWNVAFSYPYWGLSFDGMADLAVSRPDEVSETLLKWFKSFYSPLDENAIYRALTGECASPDTERKQRC